MPTLNEHIEGARARVAEDWSEAQRQIQVLTDVNAGLSDLVDQAAATHTSDTAEIARISGERDTLVAEAEAAKAALDDIDPDSEFPVPTPDGDVEPDPAPPVEPPVDPGTGGTVNPPPVDPDVPVGTGTTPDAPPPPPDPTPGDGTVTPDPVDVDTDPDN